ncbi:MAG: hypothetical protein K2L51_05160, partial [Clostridiales bacterium]|nr:hypothetical protein [Clostridiales bacterium]
MKKLGSIAVCLALVLGMGARGGCGGKSKADESARLTAHYAFDEGSGSVTREQVSGKDKKIAYVFSAENQANLYKEANDPLWRQGVSGKSLYMDGYSTYVQDDAFPNIKDDFTVSAFIAPRAFELAEGSDFDLTAIAGKGDVTIEEGFLLGYGYLGDVTFVLNLYDPADDITVKTVRITAPAARLSLYEWNHVAASYSVADARVTLYMNGAPVYQTLLSGCAGWKVQPSNEPFTVGQFVAAASAGSYKRNTVAGLLDEVRMYDGELPAADVAALYAAVSDDLALPYSEVALDASIFATDRYRPQYHAMPDGLWMNEPHAPIYYKGKYHLFFQHNAVGTYFAQIQWGHLVSDDMVSWKQVKNAVVRTEGVADKGIWTGGSVIGPDGAPWLAVTAGVTQANGSGQNIAFAHPADPNDPELTDWVLEKAVTVPQTEGTTDQFRDPFVWCDGGVYY